jgi:hypothetical protein
MRSLLVFLVLSSACLGPLNLVGDVTSRRSPPSTEHLKESVRRSEEQRLQAQREVDERNRIAAAEIEETYRIREEAKRQEAAKHELENQEHLAQVQAQWAAADAAKATLQEGCGKDFESVRVGMSWARVEECATEEFWIKYEDRAATVYESESYAVRVEKGKVTRVFFR